MDLMEMMSKMGEVQKKMEESKKKLDGVNVDAEVDGIKVQVTANKRVKNIEIPLALLEDKEQLEDMLLVVLNRAMEKAEVVAEEEAQKVSQQVIPGGLGGMFGS